MDQDAECYAVIAAALAGHAPIEEAVAAARMIPAGGPHRGALAAGLAERMVALDVQRVFPLRRELDELIGMADADPPPGPGWRRTRALARATVLAASAAVHALPDPAAALEEVDRLAADIDESDLRATTLIESVRLALSMAQSTTGRDDPVQAEAWERMQRLIERGGAAAAPLGEIFGTMRQLLADPSGDPAGLVAKLRADVARLPAGSDVRNTFTEAVEQIGALVDGDGDLGHEPLSPNEEALSHSVAGMRLIRPEAEPGGLDEGVERMRAALRASDPEHPQRVFHLSGLALALLRRSEHTNDVSGLPEAERVLIEAQALLRGPQDGAWSMVHGMLADIRLRLDAEPGSHRDSVAALRTYVWQVLMQPDPASAGAVAREAAGSAVSAAHRCLRANDAAGAVRALDAGRGLALYAATELHTVPDRLRSTGHTELADEWAAAGGRPPASLRRKAVGVLAGIAEDGALLDPPTTRQIRAALATLDLDALVYLVPATDGWPGLAVSVPVTGPLAYLSLAALRPGDSLEVTGYLEGARARDTGIVGRGEVRDLGSLDTEFAGRLDVVCDWAWRAAMGPIVEKLLPALRDRPAHRVPRLALVPMGELGLIPWQAARRTGGEPALRHAAFSQVASARMLCHSADLRPVAPSRLGMIVGDPDTATARVRSLAGARAEAYEIWRNFYRRGRYLGRLPDGGTTSASGAGTAAEVRAWLRGAGRAAGGVLHLACHGLVEAGSSRLLLAGGEALTAEELVSLTGGGPGLVVLAACSTGLAAGEYDEAYSLGTAFLAAGARSVLSTQWTIPDAATSLLMFMFHHHLTTGRLPVWQALHQAQLWMIDRDRVIPDEMPEAWRQDLISGRSDPAEIEAWAGFVHGGR